MTAVPDAATINSVASYLECMHRDADPHDVLTAVHDAWLQLASRGDPTTGGWLFSKAKTLLWTRVRGRRSYFRRHTELTGHESRDHTPVAPSVLPSVADAIAGLTTRQQFVARGLICGDTTDEQAARCGVSADCIKKRIAAVRQRLRRVLLPDGTASGMKGKAGVGRTDKMVFFRGRMMTLRSIAAEVGMAYPTLHRRVSGGMTVEQAVTRPVLTRGGVA